MSLMAALERCSEELTPVERRLTEALLAAPGQAAFLSVHEMAQRAGADAATAVRLAKKLGFGGYRDLKSALQAELLGANDARSRLERRVEPLEDDGVLSGLIDSEIASLVRLREQLSEARILSAATALRDARQIIIYGQGHAMALVDLMARRLNRHGYAAVAIREGQWSAPEAVARMGDADMLVCFAFYRMPELVPALFVHASARGARTMLISDLVGITLPAAPDHLLAATRGEPGQSHTLGVPMLVVNALMLTLARIDEGHSLAALEQLDATTKRLGALTSGKGAARGPKPV